jgi:hypothetical protein
VLTNSFPDSNDLQFARVRNEFLSEPSVEEALWPEAIGYEQTKDVYRTSEIPADMKAAIDQIEAFANDAAQHAVSVERETTAERQQYVDYAKGVTERIRWTRDLTKSDFGLSA